MNYSRWAIRTTNIGILWNIFLIVIKFLAAVFGHSSALFADAIHSISDFVSDLAVLAGIRMASRPSDPGHNYGHGKFETLATIIIAISLFAAGIGILWEGVVHILQIIKGQTAHPPTPLALEVAGASILIKEGLYRYTFAIGKQINSKPLIANAWHHRTDAFSSVTVLIGISGAYFLGGKWAMLDPIAAIIVGVFIIKFGFNILISNLNELLEASLGEEENEKIRTIAGQVQGVINPHDVKTRKIGNTIAVEMHIKVDPGLSVLRGHDIATEVENKLKRNYGEGIIISVHVEPA